MAQMSALSILCALGVKDQGSFEALFATISQLDPPQSAIIEHPGSNEALHASSCPNTQNSDSLQLVHQVEVMRRLCNFVEAEKATDGTAPSLLRPDLLGPGRPSNGPRAERERQYWRAMSNVVDPTLLRIWTCLNGLLQEYHELLHQRAIDLHEVSYCSFAFRPWRCMMSRT